MPNTQEILESPEEGDIYLPKLTRDLIHQLSLAYPHRCPLRGEPQQDVDRYAGKRELIDGLLQTIAEEEEALHEPD